MSEITEASTGPNAAQYEYWNKVAGPRRVGWGGFVERRVRAANDLLLARSAVALGETVLEVGCGTGAATLPLAEAVGDSGRVVGIDLSEPMLAVARRHVAESGRRNISLLHADAQVYGFEPDGFDLIASRFGVMFFSDPIAAFHNLFVAVKPGGRLCFVCWAPLEDNPQWLIPYEIAVRHLGPPAPKPPHAPGPMAFSDPDYVRSFLGSAGFDGIQINRETANIFGSTPQEEAEHACLMGPPGRLIDEKKPDDATLQVIRQEMEEAFAAHAKGKEMVLLATMYLVTAHRPR